jgi:hypothetical protein
MTLPFAPVPAPPPPVTTFKEMAKEVAKEPVLEPTRPFDLNGKMVADRGTAEPLGSADVGGEALHTFMLSEPSRVRDREGAEDWSRAGTVEGGAGDETDEPGSSEP